MSKAELKQSTYITADEAFRLGEEFGERRDYLNAIEYYQIAIEKGHLLAQCRLGEYYLFGRGVKTDTDKAFALIEPVSKRGISDAQYALGVFYHITSGHLDELKAREMYELAAKQGHMEAQFSLGNSLEQGYYNAPINYEEAVKWYILSAEQGKISAQYSLGVCYERGRGVEQSIEMAIKWYQKAAKQGFSAAKDRIKALKGK